MLVSHKLGCAFVHIPKNAGSSIERLLLAVDPDGIQFDDAFEVQKLEPMNKHVFARHIAGYLGEERWHDYFTFAVVRNPFERLVSWYSMCVQFPDVPYRQYVVENTADFDDFVRKSGSFPGRAAMIGFNQVDYVHDAAGRTMVDFVGRFETLHDDVASVLERIGADAELPVFNASEHDHYRTYYSPETEAVVRSRFARDLAAFGYDF